MSPTETGVQEASRQFYAALNSMANGDASPMSDIWSHDASVTTMHPIGGREVGWEEVKGPWQQVASMSSEGKITLRDQLVHAAEDLAYEVGNEVGEFTMGGEKISLNLRVTNVYRREADGWKVVHHHTDVSPEMVSLLQRLAG
jgi:ketosteroid isomerase-like protein